MARSKRRGRVEGVVVVEELAAVYLADDVLCGRSPVRLKVKKLISVKIRFLINLKLRIILNLI